MWSKWQPKDRSVTGSTAPAKPAAPTRTVTTDAGDGTDKNCAVEQCPMCMKFDKSFSCKNCIASGHFGHSSTVDVENRFFKKQMRLENIVSRANAVKNECAKKLSEKQSAALKIAEIITRQETIRVLKLGLKETKQRVKDKHDTLNTINLQTDEQKSKNDHMGKLVVEMENYTKEQYAICDDKNNELIASRAVFKSELQISIGQLGKYIFPITKVRPTFENEEELDANYSLSRELAEASNMTYVRGQWVDINEERPIQTEPGYRIVAPVLPANGDYSAYNKNFSLMTESYEIDKNLNELNPACTISAGLTYTSQLVKVLSIYLDVILPLRLKFNAFCGNVLNEDKFSKYVIYLNANVVHLCLSQNVDPKLLHPDQTLNNLLQLLDTSVSDLGRFEPPDTDSQLSKQIEEKLFSKIYLSNDGDSDSEDDNGPEWEAIPNIEFPEDHSQSSSQSTSSVETGMVASAASSIASMWRGWTK